MRLNGSPEMKFEIAYGNYALFGIIVMLVCGCKGKNDNTIYSPGFSEVAMGQVKLGMTKDEVWELLGNPFICRGPIQRNDEFAWEYSYPASTKHGVSRWDGREYVSSLGNTIAFDCDGIVTRINASVEVMHPPDTLNPVVYALRNSVRPVGTLRLKRDDGTEIALDPDEGGVHVILLDEGCLDGSCSINYGPAWFKSEQLQLVNDGTVKAVHHVHIGQDREGYRGLIGRLPEAQKHNFYIEAEPTLDLTVRDKDSRLLLYSSGKLFSVHPIYSVTDSTGQSVPYREQSDLQRRLVLSLGK